MDLEHSADSPAPPFPVRQAVGGLPAGIRSATRRAGGLAVACTCAAAVLVVLSAACGRNVKTIPPTIEGISLLGDTLWSVPVPIQGGRERVTRLQDARERLARNPGDFLTAYDVARYTADLGRFTQAIEKFGDASALGGLDPRPYARRGELYLLLRRVDRASSDLRTADRLKTGEAYGEQQVMAGARCFRETSRARCRRCSASLRWCAERMPGPPCTSRKARRTWARSARRSRQRCGSAPASREPNSPPPCRGGSGAVPSMLANATRGTGSNGCAAIIGNLVDGDLVCLVHASRLLADGRREEAVSAFDLIRSRSHWASTPHLAAEGAIARLVSEEASGSGGRKEGRRGSK